MSQETSKNTQSIIYLFLLLFVLATTSFIAYKWYVAKKLNENWANKNEQLETEVKEMEKMMSEYVGDISKDMRTDLKKILESYDALKNTDALNSDSIKNQKREIRSLMEQLDQNKISARELTQLKKRIQDLQKANERILQQNIELNQKNRQLSSDLDETSTRLNETSAERDIYKKDAEEKGEQVKKGGKLRAYSISSGALRMTNNNTTEATDRAKRVYQLKSSFTLQENVLAKQGKKMVYMSIIAPNGQVLQSRSSNSVATDFGSVLYSDKKEIDYRNQALDVTIFYEVNTDAIEKGTYQVKLYCEGVMIGEDSFLLK